MDKKKKIAAFLIAVLLVLFALYKFFIQSAPGIQTDGTIEAIQIEVRPKVSGQIEKMDFELGNEVKIGQPLAQIKRPDLLAQIQADEAALARARAFLRDLQRGTDPEELAEVEGNLRTAEAQYAKAEKDLERDEKLLQENAIAPQNVDLSRSALRIAKINLDVVKARKNLLLQGNRDEQIDAQKAEVRRLEAVLMVDSTAIADTYVQSPINGLVMKRDYGLGEYVSIGTAIGTLGDLNEYWIKVYISPELLERIQYNGEAEVKSNAYPLRTFDGRIKEIAKEEQVVSAGASANEPAKPLYFVKIKVKNDKALLKPYMPVTVIIK